MKNTIYKSGVYSKVIELGNNLYRFLVYDNAIIKSYVLQTKKPIEKATIESLLKEMDAPLHQKMMQFARKTYDWGKGATNGQIYVIVNSVLQNSRDILGIKAEDSDFLSFVDNITTEDSEKSNKIANYISKIVKDSYEKGKQDATKDAMGNFGKQKGQSSDGKGGNEIEDLGKRLAEKQNKNTETYDYFK